MNKYKSSLKYIWLAVLVISLISYFAFPQYFTADFVKSFMQDNAFNILIFYVLFTIIRPVLFIPSTVTLLMGIALYPDSFVFLLIMNMIGVVLGACILYLAGQYFTPESFFSEKNLKSFPKINEKINKHGFLIILLWSFFPLVPTDLICYVAGATRMQFLKFIIALFIGEFVLISLYLFSGQGIINLLF